MVAGTFKFRDSEPITNSKLNVWIAGGTVNEEKTWYRTSLMKKDWVCCVFKNANSEAWTCTLYLPDSTISATNFQSINEAKDYIDAIAVDRGYTLLDQKFAVML